MRWCDACFACSGARVKERNGYASLLFAPVDDPDLIRLLLNAGADVNATNAEDVTPLYNAVDYINSLPLDLEWRPTVLQVFVIARFGFRVSDASSGPG